MPSTPVSCFGGLAFRPSRMDANLVLPPRSERTSDLLEFRLVSPAFAMVRALGCELIVKVNGQTLIGMTSIGGFGLPSVKLPFTDAFSILEVSVIPSVPFTFDLMMDPNGNRL